MVLPLSVSIAFESYTARLHAMLPPFALFGVTDDPQHCGMGIVWFLGTPDVKGVGRRILREAAFWLASWDRRYPNGLHNFVDTRNLLHLRWLELLGFEFGPIVDVGDTPFVYTVRYREEPAACVNLPQ